MIYHKILMGNSKIKFYNQVSLEQFLKNNILILLAFGMFQ